MKSRALFNEPYATNPFLKLPVRKCDAVMLSMPQ